MKQKSTIIFLFALLFGVIKGGAQTQCCPFVSPIEVLFTADDAVSIVLKTTTPTKGNKINFTYSMAGNQIDITGCFTGSILDQIIEYNDTVSLSNLLPGVYSVRYAAYYAAYYAVSGSNCMPIDSQIVETNFNIGFTSLPGNFELTRLSVFPNPASEMQNLTLPPESELTELSVELFDISGQWVKTVYNGLYTPNVNAYLGDIKSGMYLYRVKSGNNVWYTKFIINR